jgi:hypothetical protein
VLLAFVADGAGSATRGGHAAEFLCPRAYELFSAALSSAQSGESVTEDLIRSVLAQLRDEVLLKADEAGDSAREWSCTFLGAICTEELSSFMQVGDGAIVFGRGDHLAPAFWPQSGEYANQTTFLTSEGALESACIEITDPVDRVALFTDGLQNLALDLTARTAYVPFFAPLFKSLASTPSIESFEARLLQLLNSPKVNQRTNDDKTLVVAVRTSRDEPE